MRKKKGKVKGGLERTADLRGEEKWAEMCASGWMLGKEEKIRAKRIKKKKSNNNRAAFISLMVPEPLTQGNTFGISGPQKNNADRLNPFLVTLAGQLTFS